MIWTWGFRFDSKVGLEDLMRSIIQLMIKFNLISQYWIQSAIQIKWVPEIPQLLVIKITPQCSKYWGATLEHQFDLHNINFHLVHCNLTAKIYPISSLITAFLNWNYLSIYQFTNKVRSSFSFELSKQLKICAGILIQFKGVFNYFEPSIVRELKS